MRLSQVLGKIEGSDSEKTASEGITEKNASAPVSDDKLRTALKEATALAAVPPVSAPAEKTAAAGSPVEDLTKLASHLTSQENEAIVKEAQMYGAACADGFMARLSQYNEAAEKIAAQQPQLIPGQVLSTLKVAGDDSFEKFAAENPALVKQAAELGYEKTMTQMQKLAEASFAKGHDAATIAVYKLAQDSFVKGFEDAGRMIQEIRK